METALSRIGASRALERREFIGMGVASLLPLASLRGALVNRPNIILIMADDLGWGDPEGKEG